MCDEWLGNLLLTPGTIAGYEIYARQWIAFFRTLPAITTERARAYYAARLKTVLRRTVRKELSALRGFLTWCKVTGEIAEVPFIPIPERNVTGTRSNPKRKTTAVELSRSEALAIIKRLPIEGRKWQGRTRTPRAFFTVLWETGLRPTTVCQIEVGRHYVKGGEDLTITAEIDKARYDRVVGLTKAARTALDSVCPKAGLLFPKADYRKLLKEAAKAADIAPEKIVHFTKYDFRHARITDVIDATGDMTGAAYMAGHKLLSTTDKYAHPSRRAGDRVIAKLSGAFRVRGPKKERREK
jgi:integrase